MSTSNRLELAPYLLVAVDAVTASIAALAVLPLGFVQVIVPLLVLLVVYASGDYSLLSEVAPDRRRGIVLACGLFMLIAGLTLLLPRMPGILPWQGGARLGVGALCCFVFATTHYGLEGYFRGQSQRVILHLRPDMADAAEALRRHIARSLYPAEVRLDGAPDALPDRLRADILHARKDQPDEPEVLAAQFDPARFCDAALRVLPPAVLAGRPDYVRWEEHERRAYDTLKRAIDAAAATLLLLVSLPLMALAAIGVALADGRPVLFRQIRVGRYGKRFSLMKFRTLRTDVEPSKTPNDTIEQRVFRFGAFLRRTRLDEIPQFINIIRGDMSLIGPRPEMEFFHERCVAAIPCYRRRLLMRPGLSGWAQVRFPHTTLELDYADKTAHDLWYVCHRSLVIDLRITLRTIGVILFGFGSR